MTLDVEGDIRKSKEKKRKMKGKKNKKKEKESKNRKDSEKEKTDPETESNVSSQMSDEQFLIEIEEYSKKLNKNMEDSEEVATINGDDQELEIDSLHQVVNELKEELEAAKTKVNDLNEIIVNKEKIIKSLEDSKNKESNDDGRPKHSKCRYWNRGFCREGYECQYVRYKEDCETYLDDRRCEDRHCERRHRRQCRYYSNIS